jgi:hypothetical protein
MANNPGTLILRRITSAMQPADKGGFTFGKDGHFIKDCSEQIIRVFSLSQRKVFAGSLLQFGIKDMRVSLKDVDEMSFDLREQVDPLAISLVATLTASAHLDVCSQEQRSSWSRAQVDF